MLFASAERTCRAICGSTLEALISAICANVAQANSGAACFADRRLVQGARRVRSSFGVGFGELEAAGERRRGAGRVTPVVSGAEAGLWRFRRASVSNSPRLNIMGFALKKSSWHTGIPSTFWGFAARFLAHTYTFRSSFPNRDEAQPCCTWSAAASASDRPRSSQDPAHFHEGRMIQTAQVSHQKFRYRACAADGGGTESEACVRAGTGVAQKRSSDDR